LAIGIGLMAILAGGVASPTAAVASESAEVGPLATVIVAARRVPAASYFIPPRVGGDTDFAGHGPRIDARATLLGVGTRQLRVRLYMDAIETQQDLTHVRGDSATFGDYLVYDAGAGQCVRGVSRGDRDQLPYVDNDHPEDVFPGQVQDSFVRQWHSVGDTSGPEAGTRTGVAVDTFELSLNVQPC
jgi:hypothetical protein